MTMAVAFYKGRRCENKSAKLFDWLICWWTSGPFSHAELVLVQGTDGRHSYCASSSIRDGGVRFKHMLLDPDKWVIVPLSESFSTDHLRDAARWFDRYQGSPYDWLGILGFVVHKQWGRGSKWYCSEAVSSALGLEQTNISPNQLAQFLGVSK